VIHTSASCQTLNHVSERDSYGFTHGYGGSRIERHMPTWNCQGSIAAARRTDYDKARSAERIKTEIFNTDIATRGLSKSENRSTRSGSHSQDPRIISVQNSHSLWWKSLDEFSLGCRYSI
jgi:hypothetical protein